MATQRMGKFFKLLIVTVFIMGLTFQPGGVGAQYQEGLFISSPIQGDMKSTRIPPSREPGSSILISHC